MQLYLGDAKEETAAQRKVTRTQTHQVSSDIEKRNIGVTENHR